MHFGDHRNGESARQSIDQEMLEFTIAKFAKFWKLGSLMLGKWWQINADPSWDIH